MGNGTTRGQSPSLSPTLAASLKDIDCTYKGYKNFGSALTRILDVALYSWIKPMDGWKCRMKLNNLRNLVLLVSIPSVLVTTACGKVHADDAAAGVPPAAKVVPFPDASLFSVENPEQFPLAEATEHPTTSELVVTGTVMPDVSRQVPVASLATGRITEIDARLGDQVTKGQLLFKVRSSDIAGAFSNYQQAVKNEELTRLQLIRANTLFENGAVPKSAQETAQNAEDNNAVILSTAKEQLGLMGVDPEHPTGVVSVYSPVAGTITDQQIANQSAVQAYSTPTPFTISDLSAVWVVCDVYENDMASVRIGDTAVITLNAYPDRKFKGRVSNILPALDPNIRTAKVRIEVENPGIMRVAMFVTATFRGQTSEMHTIVPASAVMHMHDRDFVFVPAPGNKFRREEVVGGDLLQDDTKFQEVKSGLKPGQRVVTNALVLDHVLGQ
jgi:cobalt-zinc-cadmium efflux system membrane fusion protein